MSDSGDYLSLKEVQALLGLSESTMRRRLADGTLPATKFGGVWRVRRMDLERILTPPTAGRRPTRSK